MAFMKNDLGIRGRSLDCRTLLPSSFFFPLRLSSLTFESFSSFSGGLLVLRELDVEW